MCHNSFYGALYVFEYIYNLTLIYKTFQISLERLDAESPNLSEKDSFKSEISDEVDLPSDDSDIISSTEEIHFKKPELLTGVKRIYV